MSVCFVPLKAAKQMGKRNNPVGHKRRRPANALPGARFEMDNVARNTKCQQVGIILLTVFSNLFIFVSLFFVVIAKFTLFKAESSPTTWD